MDHLLAAPHPDDLAVDEFAERLKAKLAVGRAKGRRGWQNKDECPAPQLAAQLREHVDKGDPVDVALFAMFLSLRGERIEGAQLSTLNFCLSEVQALAAFFGGSDTTVTVRDIPAEYFKDDPGRPAGKYAWCTECPEEGAVWLGEHYVNDPDDGELQTASEHGVPFSFHPGEPARPLMTAGELERDLRDCAGALHASVDA